jgi:hypothetical protein
MWRREGDERGREGLREQSRGDEGRSGSEVEKERKKEKERRREGEGSSQKASAGEGREIG